MGYPRTAAYLAAGTDSLMFRDFSYLRTRLILNQQDELRCLERQLKEIDDNEASNQESQVYLRSWEKDNSRPRSSTKDSRVHILEQVYLKLQKYGMAFVGFEWYRYLTTSYQMT